MSELSVWLLQNPGTVVAVVSATGSGLSALLLALVRSWLKVHALESEKAFHPKMSADEFETKVRKAMEGQYATRVEFHTLSGKITETNQLVIRVSDQMGSLAKVVETVATENKTSNEHLTLIQKDVAVLTATWKTAWKVQHGGDPVLAD